MGSTRFVPLAMAFVLLAGVAAPAEPQVVATMVADVGQGIPRSDGFPGDRPVTLPAVLDGWSYFYGNDGIHGLELWRSDGTPGGTHMVRDICPGRCSAASIFEQLAIARAGDRVFFAADDGVHGAELWVTDGSVSGTQLVADLRPGLRGSRPRSFQEVGNRLFFQAGPFSEPPALWVSDGTPLGTLEVKPAIGIGATAELGGKLVFGAEQPQDGLWISDGTPAGTIRISTVQPWQNSWPEGAAFRVLGSLLVFQGRDTPGPSEPTLWVTDGTAEGTQELAPLATPYGFQVCGDRLFFTLLTTNSWELWSTQGTPATTLPIPMPGEASLSFGWQTCAGEIFVFVGHDPATGHEPWSTDGASVAPLGDLRPGPDSSIGLTAEGYFQASGPFFTSLGERALLLADDGVHGLEPWVTDGTPGGTQLVLDSIPGPVGLVTAPWSRSLPKPRLGDSVLYQERAADGSLRLWKSDGTAAGTSVVDVLESQPSMLAVTDGASLYTKPLLSCFAPTGGGLVFSADDGASGRELWFTDGTEAGTSQVADLLPGPLGSYPGLCRPYGGRLLFTHGTEELQGSANDLRALDPGTAGVELLASGAGAAPEVDSSAPVEGELLLALGSIVRTDGTPGGTQLLGSASTWPIGVATSGEHSYIGALGLERYDPVDGTISPLTGEVEPWRFPVRLTPFAGDLLFFAYDPATGQELWRSDGTPEGTGLVVDLRPGPSSAIEEDVVELTRSSLSRIVAFGGVALFAADDGVAGEEVWRTDGTAAGTAQVADVFSGPHPSSPRELTRAGQLVFWSAEHPATGRELWYTADGASAQLAADLVPGVGSSVPQNLTAIRGELWFSAWTPAHGREPWRLRPGAGGLVAERLADIAPGPLSSSPLVFRAVGADVYTVANDGVHGFELWKLRDPDVLFADDFESSGLALWAAPEP